MATQAFLITVVISATSSLALCSSAHEGKVSNPINVCVVASVNDLWRDPKRFVGHRICASGYFGRMVAYGEDSPKLYATEAEAKATRLERYATIGIPFNIAVQEQLSKYSLKTVNVEGVLTLEFPCKYKVVRESSGSYCSPPPLLRIAKAHLTFADGARFP
jgi:hypothetical protein